jgi:hypothetical protein
MQKSNCLPDDVRNAGAANARLAVFAGTTSSDFLFYCISRQIL